MTVCGEKMSGVCVMGKCPYVKQCNTAVWDKNPQKPMTNEEYIRQASTEQLAREIANHIFVSCTTNKAYRNPFYAMVLHDVVEWLKEEHK